MIRFAAIAACLAAVPGAALAQPTPVPPPEARVAAFAPFRPMIGHTWRGTGRTPGVQDVQRWEWAVGGHAIRITHSVNDGVYGGETLVFRDRDSGDYVFHYFTTGGFHTTGTMRPTVASVFEIEETVHGLDGIETQRSTATLADGGYRIRTRRQRDGAWVEVGGFDYRRDDAAVVRLPTPAQP